MLSKRPKVRKPRPWTFPVPQTSQLPNGLQVMMYDRPGQHVVSAGVTLDLPLTAEPQDREGVAGLTAATLDDGTASHPGTSFLDALEGCGAVMQTDAGYSATQAYLDVPGSRLGEALGYLAEALSDPELTDADVARARSLRLAQIEQQLANPSERAAHGLRRTLVQRRYRASRMRGGEPRTLRHVSPADVRAFHRRYYGPQVATLVLAGDLDPTALEAVTQAFGGWRNPTLTAADHEVPGPRKRHLYLLDRPGSVQADVRLGCFTIDRADPRWPELQVATHALGGAFLSRLNRVLREERGFTYGVHLVNAPLRDGGYSYVQGSFRNEVVGEAVEMLPTLLDVDAAPLLEDEVERTRRYLMGVQPLQYATASGVCNTVMSLLAANLTSDFVDAVRRGYQRVAADAATEVASELLRPAGMSLVVVGDADVLAEDLRRRGWPVRVIDEDEWA